MKYTELKDELKKRNIKCTGSKDELCQKLIEAMSQDGQTAVADPAPQQPAPVEEPTKTISQGISNVYQIHPLCFHCIENGPSALHLLIPLFRHSRSNRGQDNAERC